MPKQSHCIQTAAHSSSDLIWRSDNGVCKWLTPQLGLWKQQATPHMSTHFHTCIHGVPHDMDDLGFGDQEVDVSDQPEVAQHLVDDPQRGRPVRRRHLAHRAHVPLAQPPQLRPDPDARLAQHLVDLSGQRC